MYLRLLKIKIETKLKLATVSGQLKVQKLSTVTEMVKVPITVLTDLLTHASGES